MIPLRDTTRSSGFPVVTVLIIVANGYVFFQELMAGSQLNRLIVQFAVVPAHVQQALGNWIDPAAWPVLLTLVTATFLHGSWLHIISNMLYLWVFGDNIESRLGAAKYIGFYLAVGIVANLAHVLANSGSTTPTIGASGAVAGVLGAYLISYPRARVLALIPLGFFFTVTEIRATFFLLLWFGLQLISGLGSVATQAASVAWWAHIGGFVTGAVVILLVGGARKNRPYYE